MGSALRISSEMGVTTMVISKVSIGKILLRYALISDANTERKIPMRTKIMG
jgi:hypothetical protein